ncbi:MAG: DUF4349 domain-containing protein [Eubacteriales bacterium]|nr:DUF4349 domain-containing protein [Eubacteriales bacterium]
MTCKDISTLLREDFGAAQQNEELLEHIKNCESCFELYQYRLDAKTLDDDEEMPASFSASWRENIYKEETVKFNLSPKLKRFMSVAAVFVLIAVGTFITNDDRYSYKGSQQGRENSRDLGTEFFSADEAGYEADTAMSANYSAPKEARMPFKATNQSVSSPELPKKLIRRLSLNLSTGNYDEDYKKILNNLEELNGYAEYLSLGETRDGRRRATMNLRVPQENLDKFASSIEKVGRTVSKTQSAEDVSEQYYDTQGRLESQQSKRERLQEMMKKAVSVEELIQIEDAIADTQYMIDSLSGSLKDWDSKVSYSIVNIELTEERQSDIAQVKEAGFLDRISSAFTNGLENIKIFFEDMLLFVVGISPIIVIAFVVITIVRIIIKKRRNKDEK